MTTFSQLVDRIAKELVRPDLVEMLPGYLNQTIRELFTHGQTGRPVFFDAARHEDLLAVDSLTDVTESFVWEIPRPTRFQAMESVYYNRFQKYVYKKDPRVALVRNDFLVDARLFWYRVAQAVVFSSPGRIGDTIRVSWFEFPRHLAYQPEDQRPFIYDEVNDRYLVADGTPDPEAAKDAATNWILEKHEELLAEGLRAKAYKRMSDDRQKTHYSQYETSRLGVQESEALDIQVTFER